jgi:hypothetical protein
MRTITTPAKATPGKAFAAANAAKNATDNGELNPLSAEPAKEDR